MAEKKSARELRTLVCADLEAAVGEARRLLAGGYQSRGNWTLGQICRHLCLVQDRSVDGYPGWMSLFAFLRPVMRRVLLPKLKGADPPRGIRTASIFMPPENAEDGEEVARFAASVERFREHRGPYAPHPAFGRMDGVALEKLHAGHAAHHLRFLEPAQEA